MSTFQRFKDKLVLRDEDGNVASSFINSDIRPLPPQRRTWTWKTYGLYNFGTSVLYVRWSLASSLLVYGLTVWQAILVVLIGQFLTALLGALGANIGAEWHIGFPVLNRMSWGMRGNWFPILNRVVLGCTWFAVETWFGGQVVKIAIGAIWPSFYNIHNPFKPSLGMDGGDFLCWVLFLLGCIPLIFLRIEKMFLPAAIVASMVTITVLVMLIWFCAKAHGGGVLINQPGHFAGVPLVHGATLGWYMVLGVTTQLSGLAQGILGFADWGRYAKTPNQCRIPFFLGMFLGNSFVAITGLIVSSAAATIYPDVKELLYNPGLILYNIQLHESKGARAAVFFGAIPWILSQYLLVVSACNLIGGLDLSGIIPKYINIRRGALLVFVVGCVMQPWSLLNGANVFLTVMSSYGIFLAPLTGIIHSDYYLLRRRRISLYDFYDNTADSPYSFFYGVNWRALVPFFFAQAPLFPGFIAKVRGIDINEGLSHLYFLTYPYGYIVAGGMYWGLSKLFPPPHFGRVDDFDVYGTFGPAETDPEGRIFDQQASQSNFSGLSRPVGMPVDKEGSLDDTKDVTPGDVGVYEVSK